MYVLLISFGGGLQIAVARAGEGEALVLGGTAALSTCAYPTQLYSMFWHRLCYVLDLPGGGVSIVALHLAESLTMQPLQHALARIL